MAGSYIDINIVQPNLNALYRPNVTVTLAHRDTRLNLESYNTGLPQLHA